MIRFRNPVSDINILISNFQKMYEAFHELEYFNLDHIAEFFARERLASSSGYVGEEALKRSYKKKADSRKSIKMQAKSYAEVYRFLGWIMSADKILNFTFTFIGIHVALSESGARSLFAQCLLGIEYPNKILDVKFNDINKPFVNMINFAGKLGNVIHRDEILLGPMNLCNGYREEERLERINFIHSIRATRDLSKLEAALNDLAQDNGMQITSVRNLTRFVISALEFTGWFEKQKLSIYGRSTPFLVLTEKGKSLDVFLSGVDNINGSDLDINSTECKYISRLGLLSMFERANFDVENDLEHYRQVMKRLGINYNSHVLFSPFQFFSREELKKVLPKYIIRNGSLHKSTNITIDNTDLPLKNDVFIKFKNNVSTESNDDLHKQLLSRFNNANSNLDKAIKNFMDEVAVMKQLDFYPLVSNLMRVVFNRPAYAPAAGNNNMRYDVIIPDEYLSVPVEVKSPTEEEVLSVKAIRQALENKILLLARTPHSTTFEMSSFAIGFKLPNERSDVYKLIEEIYDTYKINIAILDVESLIRAAFNSCIYQTYYELSDFQGKKGVIRFENISK